MARLLNSSTQTRDLIGALLREPEAWRYGYDLSKETALKSGTLYPLLMRLEGQGWLETRWDEPAVAGRPPRHMYRVAQDRIAAARGAFANPAASAVRLTAVPEAS